ncbi:MAG: error-prone DNA polymerase [Oligoflexales bacterium]
MASSLEKYGWHEWLCKTNFSFLTGASHPHELITRATKEHYASLCINDFDGAYGLARCFLEHKRILSTSQTQNPKLHCGAEIHLSKDHHLPILLQETLVLVVQTWQGYANLCHILTRAHKDGKNDAYISLVELLTSNVEGLVAIQPMRGLMRRGATTAAHFAAIRDHFKQRFYFAISRHLHPAEDSWIQGTVELAKELDTVCLLSQDAFFHHSSRAHLSDLLHSIRHNLCLSDASKHHFPNQERYLHSLQSLEARFAALPCYENSLQASYELANTCNFQLSSLRYHYPQEMIPEGHTAHSFLETLTWKEAKKKFVIVDSKLSTRLTYELKLIAKMNFADYFLTVWDIVHWARSQDILCQGRGSAANSAVCFILGITSVNPSNFDMLFERFISSERGDPPDIDVDFEHERREEVIRYVYERYGRDKAAMVANVITFRRKGALRAVGKALGIDEGTISLCAKLCKSKMLRGGDAKAVIAEARKEIDDKRLNPITWDLWASLTEELRGFPRHLGIHSGGFMISAMPLNQLVPREPASMEGRTVIQWCKDDIEGLGFFKIDLLCLGMLTAVRKAFSYIEGSYGTFLELSSIPHNDSATYNMIQQAETVGTFQIESRAQMTMLPRLRPRCFYDLVIEVAIIRPGPIQGKVINPYLKRRGGLEAVSYPDPVLKPILARTLGVAIFQEQAMRIAVEVGNFTPGEANELRKSIGAWNVKDLSRNLSPYLKKLSEGMRQNNYDEGFIAQILGQMQGFSDYGFPESHAVSFALIAYASSYLKCHYPAAFFTAVLNSQPMGFYSPHSLIQTAKRDGVTVLPICVNDSHWDHKLELLPANLKQIEPCYGIRLGLRLVRSLRKQGALQLVKNRNQEPFENMQAFLQKTRLVRSDLTALAAANAFQVFGLSRFDAIWISEAAPFHPILEEEEDALNWPVEDPVGQMERDFAATGTSLGPHPTTIFTQGYWSYKPKLTNIHSAGDLQASKKGSKVSVFGMILVKQAPPSAKGMVFITIEDASGFINLVFTPQCYEKYYQEIETAFFLCADGILQKAGEYRSIMVDKVHTRIKPKAQVQSLFGDEEYQEQTVQKEIKDLFEPRNYF